jgi:hypothetical protein
MLIFVLSGLLWQPDYMPRIDIGLPQIDLDAPRILAHCFLFELDKLATDHLNVDYARFMDDIDIGVDSISDAKNTLKAIDLALHTRQVRLNSGKTKILSHDDAVHHFRIRENHLLDMLTERINAKIKSGESTSREAKHIGRALRKMYYADRFSNGNGEKILKRMLTIGRTIDADIEISLLEDIILKRPNLRKHSLRVLQSRVISLRVLESMERIIASGYLMDDVSMIDISHALAEAKVIRSTQSTAVIRRIIGSMNCSSFAGLYARITLLSKFGTLAELIDILRRHRSIWNRDNWLGRLVGSLECTP